MCMNDDEKLEALEAQWEEMRQQYAKHNNWLTIQKIDEMYARTEARIDELEKNITKKIEEVSASICKAIDEALDVII